MIEKNLDQVMSELDEARKHREKYSFDQKSEQIIENLENKVLDDIFSVRIHLQRLRDQALIGEIDFIEKGIYLHDLTSSIGPLYEKAFEQRLDLVLNTRTYFNEIFAYTPEINKFVYDPVVWCENGWKLPTPQDLQKALAEGYTRAVIMPRMMRFKSFDYDRILKALSGYAKDRFDCKNSGNNFDSFLNHFQESQISPRPVDPYMLMLKGQTAFDAHPEYRECNDRQISSFVDEYEKQKEIMAEKGLKLQGLNLAEYLNFIFSRFVVNAQNQGKLDYRRIPFADKNTNKVNILLDENNGGGAFGTCIWEDEPQSFIVDFTDHIYGEHWPRTAIRFEGRS